MKRFLSILIVSCGVIAGLSSCLEDDDFPLQNNSNKPNTEQSYYYVKYEASVSAPYRLERVYVTTDKGSASYNGVWGSWSGTYGPVSKGFKAQITTSSYISTTKTKISVSKNDGPFAIKATGSTGASYTIDF